MDEKEGKKLVLMIVHTFKWEWKCIYLLLLIKIRQQESFYNITV